MHQKLKINGDRFLVDLEALREFGKQGTGVIRPAFSPADIDSRRWLAEKFEDCGLTPRWDPAANLFGMPSQPGKPILIGSHSDSQPQGGWLDGAYGVVLALEVARTCQEAGGPPVAVVSFQDEESAFMPLTGSCFFSGKLSRDALYDLTNAAGQRYGDLASALSELEEPETLAPGLFSAFLEAHIEQGPVLDQAGEIIGVVETIVGSRQFEVTIKGQQNHAGTTPMALRRDAVTGFSAFITNLEERFKEIATPRSVWTIGRVDVHPNAPSIVPGEVNCSVQIRDGSLPQLDAMCEMIHKAAAQTAVERNLDISLLETKAVAPVDMDDGIVEQFCEAAESTAPGAWRRMPSGALHDAMNLAPQLPTGMIFVPSIGGISHAFEEDTQREHLVAGVQVMANTVARLAHQLGESG